MGEPSPADAHRGPSQALPEFVRVNQAPADAPRGFVFHTESTEGTEEAWKQPLPVAIPPGGVPSTRVPMPKSLHALETDPPRRSSPPGTPRSAGVPPWPPCAPGAPCGKSVVGARAARAGSDDLASPHDGPKRMRDRSEKARRPGRSRGVAECHAAELRRSVRITGRGRRGSDSSARGSRTASRRRRRRCRASRHGRGRRPRGGRGPCGGGPSP